jgi:hypothetical protein
MTYSKESLEDSSLRCFSKLYVASWLRSLQACKIDRCTCHLADLLWKTSGQQGSLSAMQVSLAASHESEAGILAHDTTLGLQTPSKIVEKLLPNARQCPDAKVACRLTLSQAPSDFRRSGSLKKSCFTSLFFSVTMSTCPCIGKADGQLIMPCPFASDHADAKEAQHVRMVGVKLNLAACLDHA